MISSISEELNNDLVEADHMFALAIAYAEEDEVNLDRAVANRFHNDNLHVQYWNLVC